MLHRTCSWPAVFWMTYKSLLGLAGILVTGNASAQTAIDPRAFDWIISIDAALHSGVIHALTGVSDQRRVSISDIHGKYELATEIDIPGALVVTGSAAVVGGWDSTNSRGVLQAIKKNPSGGFIIGQAHYIAESPISGIAYNPDADQLFFAESHSGSVWSAPWTPGDATPTGTAWTHRFTSAKISQHTTFSMRYASSSLHFQHWHNGREIESSFSYDLDGGSLTIYPPWSPGVAFAERVLLQGSTQIEVIAPPGTSVKVIDRDTQIEITGGIADPNGRAVLSAPALQCGQALALLVPPSERAHQLRPVVTVIGEPASQDPAWDMGPLVSSGLGLRAYIGNSAYGAHVHMTASTAGGGATSGYQAYLAVGELAQAQQVNGVWILNTPGIIANPTFAVSSDATIAEGRAGLPLPDFNGLAGLEVALQWWVISPGGAISVSEIVGVCIRGGPPGPELQIFADDPSPVTLLTEGAPQQPIFSSTDAVGPNRIRRWLELCGADFSGDACSRVMDAISTNDFQAAREDR